MKPVDFSLESLRFTVKEIAYLLSAVVISLQAYTSIVDQLHDLNSSVLEGRISSLNMELSYMENKARDESEQRRYEIKKDLVKKLMADLEDMQ